MPLLLCLCLYACLLTRRGADKAMDLESIESSVPPQEPFGPPVGGWPRQGRLDPLCFAFAEGVGHWVRRAQGLGRGPGPLSPVPTDRRRRRHWAADWTGRVAAGGRRRGGVRAIPRDPGDQLDWPVQRLGQFSGLATWVDWPGRIISYARKGIEPLLSNYELDMLPLHHRVNGWGGWGTGLLKGHAVTRPPGPAAPFP